MEGKKGERGKEEEWRKERGGGVEVRKGKGVIRWKSEGKKGVRRREWREPKGS